MSKFPCRNCIVLSACVSKVNLWRREFEQIKLYGIKGVKCQDTIIVNLGHVCKKFKNFFPYNFDWSLKSFFLVRPGERESYNYIITFYNMKEWGLDVT